MPSDDDVQLPDLQVIQRYSLAVRGATAPRADVIAALEADLAWLTGGRRRTATPRETAVAAPVETPPVSPRTPVPATKSTAAKKLAAKRTPAPVKKAAAKTLATKRSPATKKAGARRG
jgi:hypothetical protein